MESEYLMIPVAMALLVGLYAGLVCIEYWEGRKPRSKFTNYVGDHTAINVDPKVFLMGIPRYRRSVSPKDQNST